MTRLIPQAGGIVLLGDRLVLHITDFGNLNFPKGTIKRHESPEQAAIREVLEETGVRATVVEPAGSTRQPYLYRPVEVEYFIMRGDTTSVPSAEARLVALDDVATSLSFTDLRDFWRSIEARVRAIAARA
jgi:8-oxo-dGTP pyrophosphatase MutT (NUDIX family)